MTTTTAHPPAPQHRADLLLDQPTAHWDQLLRPRGTSTAPVQTGIGDAITTVTGAR